MAKPKPKPKPVRWKLVDGEWIATVSPKVSLGVVCQQTGFLYFVQAETPEGITIEGSGFADTERTAKARAAAEGRAAHTRLSRPPPKYFGAVIRCNSCRATIQSRHRHDFATCQCRPWKVAVDGGGDYCRLNYAQGADWTVVKEGRYLIDETK